MKTVLAWWKAKEIYAVCVGEQRRLELYGPGAPVIPLMIAEGQRMIVELKGGIVTVSAERMESES
jgi:hypothetical protein